MSTISNVLTSSYSKVPIIAVPVQSGPHRSESKCYAYLPPDFAERIASTP